MCMGISSFYNPDLLTANLGTEPESTSRAYADSMVANF